MRAIHAITPAAGAGAMPRHISAGSTRPSGVPELPRRAVPQRVYRCKPPLMLEYPPQELSDHFKTRMATVKVGREGHRFHIPSSLLCESSIAFENLLVGAFMNGMALIIQLPFESLDKFRQFMKFMYRQKDYDFDENTGEALQRVELYHMAMRYRADGFGQSIIPYGATPFSHDRFPSVSDLVIMLEFANDKLPHTDRIGTAICKHVRWRYEHPWESISLDCVDGHIVRDYIRDNDMFVRVWSQDISDMPTYPKFTQLFPDIPQHERSWIEPILDIELTTEEKEEMRVADFRRAHVQAVEAEKHAIKKAAKTPVVVEAQPQLSPRAAIASYSLYPSPLRYAAATSGSSRTAQSASTTTRSSGSSAVGSSASSSAVAGPSTERLSAVKQGKKPMVAYLTSVLASARRRHKQQSAAPKKDSEDEEKPPRAVRRWARGKKKVEAGRMPAIVELTLHEDESKYNAEADDNQPLTLSSFDRSLRMLQELQVPSHSTKTRY